MSPIPDPPEEKFDEAAKKFNLEKLRADLEAAKHGRITEAPWRYFKGVLCEHDTKEIATKCQHSQTTVKVALSRDVAPYLKIILKLQDDSIDTIGGWIRVPQLLAKAGYGLPKPSQKPLLINWREVCRSMLEPKRELASNLFTSGMGIKFELDDIHVPLGLVERPQKVQRRDDSSPEEGSRVYREEKEKITPIDYDDFFQQVLANQQSPKNNGKHLTIIGEPGAGKTTQLLKIADWVLDETEELAIWISLGVVGEKPLQEYLLKDWLRDAAGKLDAAPPQWVEQLEQHLQDGRVWLLLDGADEMQVADPLGKLAEFVRVPLLKNVRVVLTCRLNLWDAAGNALSEFDTYKMLDFSYGDGKNSDQVKQFIDKWFANPSSALPYKEREQEASPRLGGTEGGQQLRKALDETGKERIKDLARHPLRLALLCFTWQSGRGLPDTKAELYEMFVEALYVLKKGVFFTTSSQQIDLKAALGRLAWKAIDKGFKSILPHSLVYEELEKPYPELFELADKLGWLNQVGVEPENSLKPVYAFFHPTFQEYFAATVINNWNFFLPRQHKDKPVKDKEKSVKYKRYRVFELQWKEVILLWLGRQDEKLKEQKEQLIKGLVEFCDGCDSENLNFYWFRAYFLAAEGIREFPNCKLAKVIVEQVAIWACSKRWLSFDPLSETAREILRYTDQSRAIDVLIRILHKSQPTRHDMTCLLAATGLLEIESSHQEAISALTTLMNYSDFEPIEWLAARVLLKKFPHHPEATEKLIGDLDWEDKKKSWRSFYGKSEEIANLIRMLCSSSDKSTRIKAAQSLMKIREVTENIGDYTLSNLIESIHSNQYGSIGHYYFLMTDILGHIGFANKNAINFLIRIIDNSNSFDDLKQDAIDWIRRRAIDSLGKIATGDLKVVKALTQVIYGDFPIENRYKAAINLGGTATSNPIIILHLIEFICTGWVRRNEQNNSLGTVSNFSDFERPELNAWYRGKVFYQQAPELLHAATQIIFAALTQGNFYQTVVTKLSGCLQEDTDNQHHSYNDRYESCYQLIWHCAQNMSYPDFYEAWHRQSTTTHPEAPDNIPVGNFAEAQILEAQNIEFNQLRTSAHTHPLAINLLSLKEETEQGAIAQKLCNKIYKHQAVKIPGKPPTVKSDAELQQHLFEIQDKLQRPNLALVLYIKDANGFHEPTEEAIAFCQKLADPDLGIHLAWITNQSLEQPLKDIQPDPLKLISKIQSWIDEIV